MSVSKVVETAVSKLDEDVLLDTMGTGPVAETTGELSMLLPVVADESASQVFGALVVVSECAQGRQHDESQVVTVTVTVDTVPHPEYE